MVKSLPAVQATWAGSRGQEDPLKREWLPTLVVLPRESTDRGAWRATVHGVKKSWTRLSDLHIHVHNGVQLIRQKK